MCLAALTACSSAGDGATEAAYDSVPEDAAAPAAGGSAPEVASVKEQRDAGTPDIAARSLVKTGTIDLSAKDVGEVLSDVYAAVDGAGGEVVSENTVTDDDGDARRSNLTLEVPVDAFTSVMSEVAGLATLEHQTRTVEDVTGAVADINSRVASAEQAIASLRRLFTRADKLGHIITLESQLAQRQADLEALQAQQRALAGQTEKSTITVSVIRIDKKAAAPDERRSGFLAGLDRGWEALKTTMVAISTALGLLLPLGSVLLMVALLARLAYRRWAAARPAAPVPAPEG